MATEKREQKKNVQGSPNTNRHSLVSTLKSRVTKIKPEKFGWDDVAQQIIGAFLFSSPFAVTEEVWNLAFHLSPLRTVFLVGITIFISSLIFYYTKFQKLAMETEEIGPIHVPRRLLSLLIISYSAAFLILWIFGIVGEISDPIWILKLVIFVAFFSSIGAATADILK